MAGAKFTNTLRPELTEAGVELLMDVGGMIYKRSKYAFKTITVAMALQAAADPACRELGLKGETKAAQEPNPSEDKKVNKAPSK